MIRAGDLGLAPVDRPEDWERYYARVREPGEMPWFSACFDDDVGRALESHGVSSGRVLDVGTGPGNHAAELARRGFDVTGLDLSPSVIELARRLAREAGVEVRFVAGSILAPPFEGTFHACFDRGCFHCLPPATWEDYARVVRDLLEPGGILVLKTFSHLDRGEGGPHRFHPDELDAVFAPLLERRSMQAGVYRGTMPEDELPRALVSVWRKPA